MQSSIRKHEMELVEVHSSGAEEWHCPICERRFVIQWPPNYQKIVLTVGDEYAFHSCHKGSEEKVKMQTRPLQVEDDEVVMSAELRDALDEFLDTLDLED